MEDAPSVASVSAPEPATSARRRSGRLVFSAVAVAILVGASVGSTLWILSPHDAPAYTGQLRTYYIAAEPVVWNFTPSGMNEITGEPFGVGNATELQYTARNRTYLGTSLLMCLYEQYTNASFSARVARPPDQAYLGLLGPVIYAVTGDTIRVEFRNDCAFPESITPLGLPPSEGNGSIGIPYNGSTPSQGGVVAPGATTTYSWYVPPAAGPTPLDNGTTLYEYTSGAWENSSLDTGLVGPIVISSPQGANPNGTPDQFAGTFIELFAIFQEWNSPYLNENIARFAEDPSAAYLAQGNPNWIESLNKYTINGYLYGNQPMVTLEKGQNYQWLILGAGADMHAPHWHGNTVVSDGMRTDVVTVLPGQTVVADMTPDDPGVWLFHCHVDDHLAGGMVTRYEVLNDTSPSSSGGGTGDAGAEQAAAFVHAMLGDAAPAPREGPGSSAASPSLWSCEM